jgi:hypothetical protein
MEVIMDMLRRFHVDELRQRFCTMAIVHVLSTNNYPIQWKSDAQLPNLGSTMQSRHFLQATFSLVDRLHFSLMIVFCCKEVLYIIFIGSLKGWCCSSVILYST